MFKHGFPPEWSTLKKLIWLVGSGIAGGSGALATLTGSIVSFFASAAKPVNSLVVNILPQQSGSGDPSPTNIRPIKAWTECKVIHSGKNLYQFSGHATSGKILNSEGQIADNDNYGVGWISPAAPGVYTISVSESNSQSSLTKVLRAAAYDSDGNVLAIETVSYTSSGRKKLTITAPEGTSILRLSRRNTATSCLVERNSTNTDFESFQGGELAVTLPAELEDHIGGGELTIHQDGSATFVYKYRIIDGGAQTWTRLTTNDLTNFYFSWSRAKFDYDNPTVISSRYKSECTGKASADDDKFVRIFINSSNEIRCGVKDTANASKTAAQFKTLMSGVQFCALLSEENWETYELTAEQVSTLAGLNHIWSDGNSVSVKIPKSILTDANPIVGIGTAGNMILLDSDAEITLSAAQSLNMLLGGLYTNNHTADDVSDEEALNIILGGDNA